MKVFPQQLTIMYLNVDLLSNLCVTNHLGSQTKTTQKYMQYLIDELYTLYTECNEP